MAKNEIRFGKLFADRVFQQIASFGKLPAGWCYGKGVPVSSAVRLKAVQVVQALQELGLDRFEAFPAVTGDISVSAGIRDDVFVEVHCLSTGLYDVVVSDSRDILDEADGVRWPSALRVIVEHVWRESSSTGSSTQFITAMNGRGSTAPHFRHLVMGVQSFARNAPAESAGAHARTFMNTIAPRSGANRRSIAA